MTYEWNRFIYWLGQNSTVVQALTSVVTVVLTAILAGITYRYMKLTRTLTVTATQQANSAVQQLRLLAHPNPAVGVRVNREIRSVSIQIFNRGAYPFRLDNGVIEAADDDGRDFTIKLHEICGVIVGGNHSAQTTVFLHDRNVELDSGAFEDWVSVKFDCEDVIGLVKRSYLHTRVNGLREV